MLSLIRARLTCRLHTKTHDEVEGDVRLIAYYVAFMILGDLAAYLIGLISERQFGSQVSLIVFLTLYFLFLWIAWVIAVWMTEPKRVEATDGKPT
jgi:cation transporter-like permease